MSLNSQVFRYRAIKLRDRKSALSLSHVATKILYVLGVLSSAKRSARASIRCSLRDNVSRLPCAHGPSRAQHLLYERSERASNKLDKCHVLTCPDQGPSRAPRAATEFYLAAKQPRAQRA